MNNLLFTIINNAFNLLQMLILIRVILSWITHDPYNQFILLLYQITEPILKPVREILPMQSMGMDFSLHTGAIFYRHPLLSNFWCRTAFVPRLELTGLENMGRT